MTKIERFRPRSGDAPPPLPLIAESMRLLSVLAVSVLLLSTGCGSGDRGCSGADSACTTATSILTGTTASLPLTTVEWLGSCCLPDGDCRQRGERNCLAAGGSWDGSDWDCAFAHCSEDVRVVFSLTGMVGVAALQFEVDYGRANGRFEGDGNDVACAHPADAPSAIVDWNHLSSEKLLRVGMLSLANVEGPARLAACRFRGIPAAPLPDDFIVTVVDASDIDLDPVVPRPQVAVTLEAWGGR